MELEYKKDFEQARRDWIAFWEGKARRPLVSVTLPKHPAAPPCPSPYRCAFGNIEDIARQVGDWAASHEFLAGSIPFYHISFAPDHLALLLGADILFNPDSPQTHWVVPCIKDWERDRIAFRPESHWWQRTVECIRIFRRHFEGKMLLSGPNLQGGLDCLSAMRGVEPLLMDLVTTPELVKKALREADQAADEVREALARELDIPRYGSLTRHGMYGTGLSDVAQCDFSCMIGTDMFREFGIPSLEHEVRKISAAEYHLDGPGALRHLEAICAIDKISVIQWQPGSGNAAEQDWTELYRRIDRLGKGQILFGQDLDTIKKMWREFKSRRLFFQLKVSSRREAEKWLAELDALEK